MWCIIYGLIRFGQIENPPTSYIRKRPPWIFSNRYYYFQKYFKIRRQNSCQEFFFTDPNFQVCEFQNLRKTKCWRLWSSPSLRYDTKLAVSVLKVEYIYWSPKVMMPVSRPVWSSEIIGLHQKSFPGSIWCNKYLFGGLPNTVSWIWGGRAHSKNGGNHCQGGFAVSRRIRLAPGEGVFQCADNHSIC